MPIRPSLSSSSISPKPEWVFQYTSVPDVNDIISLPRLPRLPLILPDQGAVEPPSGMMRARRERSALAGLILQPDFGRSTSFPMAFPGLLLVPAAPARPGARSRMVRRLAPDQVPQQAAHFRHGERQQIGLAIECAFFPLRLCSEARQDRRGPASPA